MLYHDLPVFGTEEKDSLVYSRLLLQCGRGYPLWNPQPSENLSDEEQIKGIQIGDVGVLTEDGALDAFLNIGLSNESLAFNARRAVPSTIYGIEISTLEPRPLVHGEHFPGVVFTPTERQPPPQFERSTPPGIRVQVHFRGSGEKSAALSIFPDTRTLVQECSPAGTSNLRDHASRNHRRWFEFVRRTPHYTTVRSLFLVTGFTKSQSWAKALMRKSKDTVQCSVTFTKTDGQDDSLEVHTSPTDPSDSFSRRRSQGNSTDPNHALFVKGFLITARSRLSFGLGGVDFLDTLHSIDAFGKLFKDGGPFLEGKSGNTRIGGGGLHVKSANFLGRFKGPKTKVSSSLILAKRSASYYCYCLPELQPASCR
ncbi:hypothetical protein L218DRAFT_377677 [Marasmius fiardii PR-910]|nr:hypothetical protein L218DRAFT_377677 [Marasmius fiardii PR-910]